MQPVIIIPENIKNKIQFIVNECDLEVSGLGTVVFNKEYNGYMVTDICLLKQEVGAAHTDLDDDAVAQAVYETRNAEGELAFWWHSHVNMQTFWSSQDHETMNEIGKNGLCVAVVFNKKEEMRGAIIMSPKDAPAVKFDNVDITTVYSYDFDEEKLRAEIKEKVQPKKETPIVGQIGKGMWDFKANPDFHELRLTCGKKWSQMSKLMKNEYVSFEDYFEQKCWDQIEEDQVGRSSFNAIDDKDGAYFPHDNYRGPVV